MSEVAHSRMCGPEHPFAAGNWSPDLLLSFFNACNFFTKKIGFVKLVDASFLHYF